MALISGVPEPKIMEVKRKEITEPIRESIARRGNRPRLFSRVVTVAVEALEFLIASVLFKKPREVSEQTNVAQAGTTEPEQTEQDCRKYRTSNSVKIKEEKAEPKQPRNDEACIEVSEIISKLRKNWTNKILQFNRNKNSFLQRKKNCQKSRDGLKEERKKNCRKKLMN